MQAIGIGTLKESSLHNEIKQWYRQEGDLLEIKCGGYTIDILRGDWVIEVQTGSFSKLRKKLSELLIDHRVRLVYPVPVRKWISRIEELGGTTVSRRFSPKQGSEYSVFDELVFLQSLINSPNLSLEILLIEQEDIWINDAKGSWRRKRWSILDRQLLCVINRAVFTSIDDYRFLLPEDLGQIFSSRELSNGAGITPGLARKMLYCFTIMGIIQAEAVKNRRKYYSLV